jgi:hypothetical protein
MRPWGFERKRLMKPSQVNEYPLSKMVDANLPYSVPQNHPVTRVSILSLSHSIQQS